MSRIDSNFISHKRIGLVFTKARLLTTKQTLFVVSVNIIIIYLKQFLPMSGFSSAVKLLAQDINIFVVMKCLQTDSLNRRTTVDFSTCRFNLQ